MNGTGEGEDDDQKITGGPTDNKTHNEVHKRNRKVKITNRREWTVTRM